jgi:hypothetical protein
MDTVISWKFVLRWGVIAAALSACNGSHDSRALVNGQGGSESDAGQSGNDGSDGNAADICVQVMPTTASGTCPVMPASGKICAPPITSLNCGSRGNCAYTTTVPEQYCPPVCGDQNGTCPPASTVCFALGSCQTAADCKGDLPQDCKVCPLSPDGLETTACAHWVCDAGTCAVNYCESQSNLSCPGGHGCPKYEFPVLDNACTQDTDCVLEPHIVTCCQTEVVGIAMSEKAQFEALESTCRAILDPPFFRCGCVGNAVDENGNYPQPGQQIVAACDAGRCKSVVRGQITCGNSSCPEGQSCCVAPDATGFCVFTCAASCPPSNMGCAIH